MNIPCIYFSIYLYCRFLKSSKSNILNEISEKDSQTKKEIESSETRLTNFMKKQESIETKMNELIDQYAVLS